MRKPRIFRQGPLSEGIEIALTGAAAHHVSRVLRLGKEDALILFNGDGLDYASRIKSVHRQEIVVAVGSSRDPGTESPVNITLLQGLCRGPRMDMLIQKSTELGVRNIWPIRSERGIIRFSAEKSKKKVGHWQAIAVSACEQSGRSKVPLVRAPETLSTIIDDLDGKITRIMLDPSGSARLGNVIDSSRAIALLVGPEGGFTDTERTAAVDAGFQRVGFGPRILRTETAPITAISIIQFILGDLGKN